MPSLVESTCCEKHERYRSKPSRDNFPIAFGSSLAQEQVMAAEAAVHIVDDDPAVRRTLERLLDGMGFQTRSYDSPSAFLDIASSLSAGCLVLDIRIPGMDGLELQARLLELGIALPVIVVTGQGDVESAVRAMKAGAVDYIEKPYGDAVLRAAINTALSSGGWIGRDREAMRAAQRIAALSRREREVLDALVEGRVNKVIAYDLGISVRTVEVHRARMMVRLGVRQLPEAVRLAVIARLAPKPTRSPGKC
jgi:two-component system, LuxR family, response regulator FixJ